jgi:hypothetical protein
MRSHDRHHGPQVDWVAVITMVGTVVLVGLEILRGLT